MLEIVDRSLRCQVSRYQGGLYSTAICGHNHSSRIANGHNSIGISSGEGSVDREAIPDHRSLVPANQPFRGDRVLLNETGEEIAYLPISLDVWFPDPDSNVCPSVSLGNYPPVSPGEYRGSMYISATSCSTLRSVIRYSMFVATA